MRNTQNFYINSDVKIVHNLNITKKYLLFVFILLLKVFYITNSFSSELKCLDLERTSNYHKDFNFLIASLDQIHPNYTMMIGKIEIENQIKKIREKISYSCDNKAFSKLIIPFIEGLGLSHLSMMGAEVNVGTLSPFSVTKLKDGYFLNNILLNKNVKLQVGDRIISINGIAIEVIWQKMSEFTGHIEPPRVYRRPVCLSYAALGVLSSAA